MTRTKSAFLALLAVLLSPMAANAVPIELITNGSFETGDATGWTIDNAGSGDIAITNNNAPPNSVFPTPGASDGSFYAVSYQGGPGVHALSQTFTAGAFSSLILTFDMFVQTNATETINPAGLTYTEGANQHARVDLLSFGAGAFDTGPSVVQNFYIGIDGRPTQPYTSYSFDLTGLLNPGDSYILRFAQADTLGNFNLGVDNVSLVAQVPEPGTLALLGIGLFGMGLARR